MSEIDKSSSQLVSDIGPARFMQYFTVLSGKEGSAWQGSTEYLQYNSKISYS